MQWMQWNLQWLLWIRLWPMPWNSPWLRWRLFYKKSSALWRNQHGCADKVNIGKTSWNFYKDSKVQKKGNGLRLLAGYHLKARQCPIQTDHHHIVIAPLQMDLVFVPPPSCRTRSKNTHFRDVRPFWGKCCDVPEPSVQPSTAAVAALNEMAAHADPSASPGSKQLETRLSLAQRLQSVWGVAWSHPNHLPAVPEGLQLGHAAWHSILLIQSQRQKHDFPHVCFENSCFTWSFLSLGKSRQKVSSESCFMILIYFDANFHLQ